MRLRQIAFIANKIAPVADQLGQVFGLKVGFRDPGVEVFGLNNVVMPVGGEFLEVLEPFRDDASGARYLARRGGDAGYMVILQDADALGHRARLEAAGVRVIAKSPDRRYQYTHFHPGDCAGVLTSIDSVVGDAAWRPKERLAAGRPGLAQLRERAKPRHRLGHHPVARSGRRRRALVDAAGRASEARRACDGDRARSGSHPLRRAGGLRRHGRGRPRHRRARRRSGICRRAEARSFDRRRGDQDLRGRHPTREGELDTCAPPSPARAC